MSILLYWVSTTSLSRTLVSEYIVYLITRVVYFMAENEIVENTSVRIVNCDMILTMSVVDDLVFRVEHLTDKLQFR
jgi:hypothetical protein